MKPFYRFCYISVQALCRGLFHLSLSGRENIPREGPFLAASNHIAYFDPVIIGALLKQEVSFLARAELFNQFLIKSLVKKLNSIPVHRGKFDLTALKSSIFCLKQKRMPLLMFPEGTRIKTGELARPLRGIAFIAAQTKVPILPIYIENSQRLLDCMLFRRRLRVRFGKPLEYAKYGKFVEENKQYQFLADLIMARIQELKNGAASDIPGEKKIR